MKAPGFGRALYKDFAKRAVSPRRRGVRYRAMAPGAPASRIAPVMGAGALSTPGPKGARISPRATSAIGRNGDHAPNHDTRVLLVTLLASCARAHAEGGTSCATPVTPPNAPTTTVTLVAARRGTLVISEFFSYCGFPTIYNWGSYIEIYDNGDSVAYLDGMYLAYTSWLAQHTAGWADCAVPEYSSIRNDSLRLWVIGGVRFPGSGNEYAIPPGEARVNPTDALDHRTASGSTNFPDLWRGRTSSTLPPPPTRIIHSRRMCRRLSR